ncbi:MAG: hypothetical protein C0453_11110 [Comamonadaceae bacterium]|nr:hypothetical protein [Comamonadaceae bacterium]
MPWLKLLHISAVIVWCGTILYLPTLLRHSDQCVPADGPSLRQWPRKVFIGIATPAALAAIASGTLIFVTEAVVTTWLIYKLAAVGLLVLGHGVCGMLVLRAEAGRLGACRFCHVLTAVMLITLLAIAWLVLRKPA